MAYIYVYRVHIGVYMVMQVYKEYIKGYIKGVYYNESTYLPHKVLALFVARQRTGVELPSLVIARLLHRE